MDKTFTLSELAAKVAERTTSLDKTLLDKWLLAGLINPLHKEIRKAGLKLYFPLLPDQSDE